MQTKYFLIFLGIILLVFIFNMFSFMDKMIETHKNKKLAEERIIKLEESREKFSMEINKLKTEKGIEENLREKFGVAKEGENMILIIEDKKEENIENNVNSYNFFSVFKDWFK